MAIRESRSELQKRVDELIEKHGSIRAAAAVLDIDHAYLYRLQVGEKTNIGPVLQRKMKLRKVVSYERV